MIMKITISIFTFLLFSFSGKAQDCTIDVGGKNTDVLITIFQMNAAQKTKMEAVRAELQIETKLVEEKIQKLFDTHPQSSPDELTLLSEKYKSLQNKIVVASIAADKKVLSTFNEKQYKRYLDLCHEAVRKPIKVTPVALKDPVVDPE